MQKILAKPLISTNVDIEMSVLKDFIQNRHFPSLYKKKWGIEVFHPTCPRIKNCSLPAQVMFLIHKTYLIVFRMQPTYNWLEVPFSQKILGE